MLYHQAVKHRLSLALMFAPVVFLRLLPQLIIFTICLLLLLPYYQA